MRGGVTTGKAHFTPMADHSDSNSTLLKSGDFATKVTLK